MRLADLFLGVELPEQRFDLRTPGSRVTPIFVQLSDFQL